MKITDIIQTLLKDDYYNGGKNIEIAKGKNELVTNYKGFKRKIKRLWRYKK